MHESCPLCGCIDIRDALPATLATIREDERIRLPRLEITVAALSMDQRAAVGEWMIEVLQRPPLSDPVRYSAFASISRVLDSFGLDLIDRTIDPASPEAAGWTLPLPHPRIVAALDG